MLAEGTISPGDLDLFTVTDSVAEAVAAIRAAEAARTSGEDGGASRPPAFTGPSDA